MDAEALARVFVGRGLSPEAARVRADLYATGTTEAILEASPAWFDSVAESLRSCFGPIRPHNIGGLR